MKRLGKVILNSASGFGVVRVKDVPKIGMDVVDSDGRRVATQRVAGSASSRPHVARVHTVIGPVKNPYVLVKGNVKVGDDLYA